MNFMGTVPIDIVWGGKLPSHGDFLWSSKRDASRALLEEWLQIGMLQGRSQYGEQWGEQLLHGPMWNMLLPSRVVGDGKIVVGCLAPSVDRVGRRYPFVVGYVFPESVILTSAAILYELPALINAAGLQIHTAIQRSWPRNSLDSIWEQVLERWSSGFPMSRSSENTLPSAGSEILDVLGQVASLEVDEQNTRPVVRGASYPWPDIARILLEKESTSFWWTHPAGGASLKAFSYDAGLDGPLMTWLFGRSARSH